MESLKYNIIGVITSAVTVSLLFWIFGNSKFKASLKALFSLSVLLSLLSLFDPVFSFLNEISSNENAPETEYVNDDTVILNSVGNNLCDYIEDMIFVKFDIPKDEIDVSVTLDKAENENITLKTVTVILSTEITVSPSLLSDYVSEALMCECIVILSE